MTFKDLFGKLTSRSTKQLLVLWLTLEVIVLVGLALIGIGRSQIRIEAVEVFFDLMAGCALFLFFLLGFVMALVTFMREEDIITMTLREFGFSPASGSMRKYAKVEGIVIVTVALLCAFALLWSLLF